MPFYVACVCKVALCCVIQKKKQKQNVTYSMGLCIIVCESYLRSSSKYMSLTLASISQLRIEKKKP